MRRTIVLLLQEVFGLVRKARLEAPFTNDVQRQEAPCETTRSPESSASAAVGRPDWTLLSPAGGEPSNATPNCRANANGRRAKGVSSVARFDQRDRPLPCEAIMAAGAALRADRALVLRAACTRSRSVSAYRYAKKSWRTNSRTTIPPKNHASPRIPFAIPLIGVPSPRPRSRSYRNLGARRFANTFQ